MDNTPKHSTSSFASDAFKNLSKVVDARNGYPSVTALRIDSTDISNSYFSSSKGSKRKLSVVDRSMNIHDSSSLVLGLGPTSSSCITISSGKEIEESSSITLGPSISPNLANGRKPEPNNIYCGSPATLLKGEEPKLDLELSLSIAPAESEDNTTVTQGSLPLRSTAEAPTTPGRIQLVDEGSTSFRWKLRPLLPPLQTIETTTPFDHVDSHFNQTPVIPTLSLPSTVTPETSFACSSAATHHHNHHHHQQQQRRNPNVKTCQYNSCIKGARGASGFCIAHGGGRRCQKVGCQKGAEGKTVFCKAHGGGRRCQHLGCTKSAEGRTDYCIGHGGGRRCSNEGCTHAARGKSGLCIRHGGGKRCKMENCSKSAEGISGLCISHGGGRRCHRADCMKGAQGGTLFCKAHGGGKRCTFLGCTKGAEGSTPFCKGHGGGKRCTFEGGCTKSVHGGTLFCVNHGGGKRCAITDCTKSARGRTSFCVRHGGGKRCKYEGCGKSAQGRTDFCKAHGGGKRCSWGHCDKFARGKSGLCASHGAQAQHKEIHGKGPLQSCDFEKMKGICALGNNHVGPSLSISEQIMSQDGNGCLGQFSLPEGRVHGGSLMAMLRGSSTIFGGSNNDHVSGGGISETGKSHSMPHTWV